ncbi:Ig-like domain repeat protein [Terriglobus aquaticus]|uniref:Ig-like domain repeat protein n=1 Tax=Terriglobus aquaticus TaxID=940139 RepID=UPI0021E00ACE|nr:Ig-like domain repeat protein [Terriglobus aquaticus]
MWACVFAALAMLFPTTVHAQGAVPDSLPVSGLRLTLKRTDEQQASLEALLKAQQTPGAAEYRRWITPEEFANRFAPDATTRQAAADWLRQQGFQVDGTATNGMRIAFRGTAAQVRRAFRVDLAPRAAVGAATVSFAADSRPKLDRIPGAQVVIAGDAVSVLADAVESNAAAAVTVPPVDASAAQEWQELLAEAAAEGITVLQTTSGGAGSDTASVAMLSNAAGLVQTSQDATSRPEWQAAAGLPADGNRALPDGVLPDVAGLLQALQTFAVQHGRVGPLAPQLYRLAVGHGIFTHEDPNAPEGTWTATDGLGAVNVAALVRALATGATGVNVALAVSNTTVTHGQALGLTYTVTGTGGTPTGTVTATLKGRSGGTATLGPSSLDSKGVASFSTTTLPGDVYDLSGTYSGDATFAPGTSNIVTSTVTPEDVVLTATAPNTKLGGTIPVTVTAKSSSGVGVPSGPVTVTAFTSATPTTYTATLSSSTSSSASTVVNVPATTLGKLTLQANCTSNGSFACNQPTSFAAMVTTATPTVTLTSTPEATVANSATQKYDLAISVAAPSGSTTVPTGTVAIQNNGVQIASVTLNNGAGTYTASLSGATNSLVAAYSGDTSYSPANSAAVVVSAPLVTTSTALSISPTTLNFGSSASFTATVTPASYATGAPTGTITFRSSLQGVVGTATLGNGFVTLNLAALQVGTHSITAVYSGDSNYSGSTSTATTLAVALGKVASTTTLTLLPAQPLAGQSTTFTAIVAPSFPAAVASVAPSVNCTGQVTFLSNNVFVANGTLSGGTVSVAGKLPVGSDSLTAVYGGDTTCYGSRSSAVVVSPARVASAISLQPSMIYANAGQTIQLTATLTGGDASLIGIPSGTVTFYDVRGGSQITLGTATLSATGTNQSTAATNVYGSIAGPHSFSAVYSGDGIFLPSTSASASVNFGDFSVSLNPGSLTVPRGGTVSGTASLSVTSGFNSSVVLTCTPPGGSQITCAFQPSTVMAGGSVGLTVTTAVQSASGAPSYSDGMLGGAGATLAALLLVPFRRTRRIGAVLLMLCFSVVLTNGCGLGMVDSTNNLNGGGTSSGGTSGGGGGTGSSGTPLGTQLLTITATSSDGTLRHTYTLPVTVQ